MKTVKLSDVLEKTSTIKWKEQPSSRAYSYVDLTSVDRSKHEITQTSNINAKNAPSRAQKIIKTGDVLFGTTRPTLNRLCIVPEEYDEQICSTGFCVLRANAELITPSFIYYLLTTKRFVEYVEVTQRGTSYPAVTDKDVKYFEFALPSLEEQQRIVGRLDAAFEKISQAEGLMRQNLDNVAALQKSILHKYLSTSGSTHTHTHRLGDLLIIERGGSPRPIKEYLTNATDGINWIKIGDVAPSAKYIESTKEKIKPDGLRKSRKVEVDDFVLSNSMSFGRPYIMKISGAIHDGWLLLRQKDKTLDKDFLYYFLSSDQAYSQFDRLAAGSTVRNLNTQAVARVEIHYPQDIKEQRKIAKRLDLAFDKIDQTRELYNEKLHKLISLRQSLLQEAFSTTSKV